MTSGESAAHRGLKRLALLWAQREGYTICGAEVAIPHSGYRADLAAYRPASARVSEDDPRTPGTRRFVTRAALGTTAIFEGKQARADFLKDSRASQAVAAKLARLQERRLTLERTLGVHFPSLRAGDSLFQEYESADLESLPHANLRRVLGRMGTLQRQLYRGLKFEKLLRWQTANALYLVAEPEVFAPAEVPVGWGLLVRSGDTLILGQRPTFLPSPDPMRLALLHRIAQATTRSLSREFGVTPEEVWAGRRQH